MSDIAAPRPSVSEVPTTKLSEGKTGERATSGWAIFAAVLLLLAGISRVFDAVWAFQYNRAVPDNLQGALFGTSLSTYGWVWLAVGALLILVGLGLLGIGWLAGSKVGRWIGIVAAAIAGLSAITWMAYYPVWSIMYAGAAALVIYALVVHDGRRTAA
jgi:hypothetical protein